MGILSWEFLMLRDLRDVIIFRARDVFDRICNPLDIYVCKEQHDLICARRFFPS